MAKFKYKFESVKKIKETLEKKVQKEISLIDLEIDETNRLLKAVLDEKDSFRNSLASKSNLRAYELQFHNDADYLLDLQAKKLLDELNQLKLSRENKIFELAQKTKEHKIFEYLEEKHYEDYLYDQNLVEQKEIDEIASKKFAREA